MRYLCHAVLLLFFGTFAVAQEPTPRATISLIVHGSHDMPASITTESLVIKDGKSLVSGASLLRGADLPLELGILIDNSNSQRGAHLDDIIKEAKQLADSLIRGPDDRAFFLTFDVESHATNWLNKEDLKGVTFKLGIGGGTALYDAINVACTQRMGPRDRQSRLAASLSLSAMGRTTRAISSAMKLRRRHCGLGR